jgi:hypothetical protein
MPMCGPGTRPWRAIDRLGLCPARPAASAHELVRVDSWERSGRTSGTPDWITLSLWPQNTAAKSLYMHSSHGPTAAAASRRRSTLEQSSHESSVDPCAPDPRRQAAASSGTTSHGTSWDQFAGFLGMPSGKAGASTSNTFFAWLIP